MNVSASLVVAAIVAGILILAHAPTWGWLGFGVTVYLFELQGGNRRL